MLGHLLIDLGQKLLLFLHVFARMRPSMLYEPVLDICLGLFPLLKQFLHIHPPGRAIQDLHEVILGILLPNNTLKGGTIGRPERTLVDDGSTDGNVDSIVGIDGVESTALLYQGRKLLDVLRGPETLVVFAIDLGRPNTS